MIDLGITAQKIQNGRREKGFTQEEFAGRLGVSAQAVSKWERGLSLPDIELLLDVSKLLCMTVEELLDNNITEYNPKKETDFFDNISSVILKTDLIMILIGADLIPCVTDSFLSKIPEFRKDTMIKTGVLLPIVRIRDDLSFMPREYAILIGGKEKYRCLFDDDMISNVDDMRNEIITKLQEAVSERLYEFVDRHTVKVLVEALRNQYPFTIDGVIPERLSLTRLKIILKSLVKDNVPINNLHKIIETTDELIEDKKDNAQIVAFLKEALA